MRWLEADHRRNTFHVAATTWDTATGVLASDACYPVDEHIPSGLPYDKPCSPFICETLRTSAYPIWALTTRLQGLVMERIVQIHGCAVQWMALAKCQTILFQLSTRLGTITSCMRYFLLADGRGRSGETNWEYYVIEAFVDRALSESQDNVHLCLCRDERVDSDSDHVPDVFNSSAGPLAHRSSKQMSVSVASHLPWAISKMLGDPF